MPVLKRSPECPRTMTLVHRKESGKTRLSRKCLFPSGKTLPGRPHQINANLTSGFRTSRTAHPGSGSARDGTHCGLRNTHPVLRVDWRRHTRAVEDESFPVHQQNEYVLAGRRARLDFAEISRRG